MMPQMGESVVEGTITNWLVKEGDGVSEDQPLVDISTDKVDTEIPSPGAGRLRAGRGRRTDAAGRRGSRGYRAGGAKTTATATPSRKRRRKPAPAPARVAAGTAGNDASAAAAGPALSRRCAAAAPDRCPAAPEPGGPRRYSPVVLKIAEEHGIDLEPDPGTGFGGRVSKRDVQRYLESLRKRRRSPARRCAADQRSPRPARVPRPLRGRDGADAPSLTGPVFRPPVYQPREGDIVEPFSRRRKLIAEHMVYSKTHSPHVGTVAEVDLTSVALREAHKDAFGSAKALRLRSCRWWWRRPPRAQGISAHECFGRRRLAGYPPGNQSWHRDGHRGGACWFR